MRKKNRLSCLALIVIILLVGGSGLALYIKSLFGPVNPGEHTKEITVQIPNQATGTEISKQLHELGLTKNDLIFGIYIRYKGIAGQLKPGTYQLNPGQSMAEIANTLVEGPNDKVFFTVPEGYTLDQLTDLLVQKELVDQQVWQQLLTKGTFDFPFVEDLPLGPRRLEGYLFPDTYQVSKDTTEQEIIQMMLERFAEINASIEPAGMIKDTRYTLQQLVTVASMVEREAKKDQERPLIASVIYNRLHIGMKLQIDATVLYALGEHREKLYTRDLQVDSPYNTYRYAGLPPGPISFPGKASLEAAFHPANTDYFYYVAKPDGSHVFAKTLAEHNANVAKYID